MLEYTIEAEAAPPGVAKANANQSEIEFDATSDRDDILPNPAELLLTSLAACMLKNVQRYSEILKIPYRKSKVSVHGKSETPMRMKVKSGKFEMIIDEPEDMGGTNIGPSPIQVLLMSLAGCINITGHQVAKQRGLKLNGINLKIEGDMNPCTFIGCSYEERAGFQSINLKVEADFEEASHEEIQSWLKETEDRCPVTDNIRALTQINIDF